MGVIKSGLYCIHTGILSLTEQIMICAADTPHKKKTKEKRCAEIIKQRQQKK